MRPWTTSIASSAPGNSVVPDQGLLLEARGRIPEDGTFAVAVGYRQPGWTDLTGDFTEMFARYFLLPRRAAPDAPWILCLACDRSGYRGAVVGVVRRGRAGTPQAPGMTVRAIAGLAAANAAFAVMGLTVLWALRGFRTWAEVLRLTGLAYLVGLAAFGVVWPRRLGAGRLAADGRSGAAIAQATRDALIVAPDLINVEVLAVLRRLERTGQLPAGAPTMRSPISLPGPGAPSADRDAAP